MMPRLLLGVALWLCVLGAQAAVTATVDKNPVLVGETLTLRIHSDGDGKEPDLSVLEPDFQVLGTSTSSQFQIINGRTQRSHEWIVQMRPRSKGRLTIPSVPLGSEATAPISLDVVEPQRQPGELPEAFIEFSASKEAVYLREEVQLLSRLFVRGDLVSGNFSEPASEHAVIEQLGEQTESQALRGNYRYRVIERRHVLYPEQSGELLIRAPVFNGELATGAQRRNLFGFSGASRAIYAAADALTLTVKPRPAAFTGDHWLPARHVQLSEEISPTAGPYPAGDPLTRTITLTVRGQLHTQLPELDIPVPAGTQSYTELPQDQTAIEGNGLSAMRRYSVAVIPQEGGVLELPELRLHWWDTERDQMRTAVLPARTLQVQGEIRPPAATPTAGETAAAQASPADQSGALWPWQVATVTALAGWIGTLLGWWWSGRRTRQQDRPASESDSPSRRDLLRRLESESPADCREALLRWAREQIGPMPGLLGLSRHTQDPAVIAALRALDAAAYGHGGAFDRQCLIRFVREFRHAPPHPSPPALAPLYPETR